MGVLQRVFGVVICGLLLCGCSGIIQPWTGRKIVSISVDPNLVHAGDIAYINVKTKTKLGGGAHIDIAYTVDIDVTGGKLYRTKEDAITGVDPTDPWGKGGGQTIHWGEVWWVAPEEPQVVTIQAEFAGDKKTIVVEVLP